MDGVEKGIGEEEGGVHAGKTSDVESNSSDANETSRCLGACLSLHVVCAHVPCACALCMCRVMSCACAQVRCRMHAPRASAMACACARLRQEIQCHATHGARIVVLVLCDAMCGARIVFGPV